MAKKQKIMAVKAWAVLRRNNTIDPDAVARTRAGACGLFDLFDGEKIVPVIVSPRKKGGR